MEIIGRRSLLQKPRWLAGAEIGDGDDFRRTALSRLFLFSARVGVLIREGRRRVFRILRPNEAAERLGVARSTLWRWAKDPNFPRKYKLSAGGAVGWSEDELAAWLERQRAQDEACVRG
jgi:predicted DNA-binding transcriptional regulator AlpA